jgi:superfamily II DNA or RNA helicase
VNATDFKIGLSGTLPTEGLDAAWVEGALGRKEDIVRLKELIDKRILTPVEVISLIVPYAHSIRPKLCSKNYKEEYSLITNNGSRKRIMDLLFSSGKIRTDENTVMLYKTKSTLADMHKYLVETYPQFKYHVIQGDIETDEREKIRKEMENSTGNIIIATYGTMKQGVNIKLLHNLVLAEFSKSMYEVVQSIGRIVRPHKAKKLARVFDVCDNASYYTKPQKGGNPRLKENYAMQHYRFRKLYYQMDDIPVTELELDGILEATVDPESLKDKKEAAVKAVSKKKKKAVKKPIKSQFI